MTEKIWNWIPHKIISIDPGITNLGMTILNDKFYPVVVGTFELDSDERLSFIHDKCRMLWLKYLTDSVLDWTRHHLIPNLSPKADNLNLVVIEENDLKLTRDFAGILTGILSAFDNVRVVTVLPRVVIKDMIRNGLPCNSTRGQKKLWTRNFMFDFNEIDLEYNLDEDEFDEHTIDAWYNAFYTINRLNREIKTMNRIKENIHTSEDEKSNKRRKT